MRPRGLNFYRTAIALAAIAFTSPELAQADFTYTETTQMTGGSALAMMKMAGTFSRQARQSGEPIVSTIALKGNRMARINPYTAEIVDLDAETITTIDMMKHQYTVMTFEQLRQQVEAGMQKAKEQQEKSAQAPPQQPPNTEIKFQVHVRDTGATKDVAGLNAGESILTMAMDAKDQTSGQTGSLAITNDMWLVPEIPGYEEVREFYRRYAVKMGSVFSGTISPAMVAQYRGAGQGMSEMVKEMSKLKGTPVLQVMRMGMTTDGKPLPAASESPLPPPPATPAMPSAGDVAQQSASSAIASKLGGLGALGGFGGFGHKKQAAPPPADTADSTAAPAGAAAPPPTSSVLIESTTQLTSFSATASPASFSIPAGFQQVDYKSPR
jgi:hypothetical protein